jgi:hypothetical protein
VGISGGLLLETGGLLTNLDAAVLAGRGVELLGAVCYAYLLLGLFVQRTRE